MKSPDGRTLSRLDIQLHACVGDSNVLYFIFLKLRYFRQICLIHLLSTEDGRPLDMNAALTQISAVFRVASEINVSEDSLSRRFNQLISISVKDAHTRRLQLGVPIDSETGGESTVHSRMGL